MHAILGVSEQCCATHPSDLAVALVALGASVRLQSVEGTREVKLEDFYLLPGSTPDKEHDLRPGELITQVLVPPLDWARKSLYLKIRDRASYEFALVSAAAALQLDGKIIRDARVGVGGVGTKPWNLPRVCEAMIGQPVKQDTFEVAAKLAAEGARPLKNNAFKVALLQRTIVRAFMNLGGLV
jgi:xanthine dehydrogenase YagS FAD-binding subunit